MARFVPIDLTAVLNSGRERAPEWHPSVADAVAKLPGGQHVCWGIPFRFGPERGDPSLLVLSGERAIVAVGGRASHLLFAHFCDAAVGPSQVDPHLGAVVAHYVVVYADGSEHRQPIRRRFEVQAPGATGYAQTAVGECDPLRSPGTYWLYALQNPHPERWISALRLEPSGSTRVAIGAITLFEGDGNPLRGERLEAFRVSFAEA